MVNVQRGGCQERYRNLHHLLRGSGVLAFFLIDRRYGLDVNDEPSCSVSWCWNSSSLTKSFADDLKSLLRLLRYSVNCVMTSRSFFTNDSS
jgi:hypothetical protein